MDPPQARSPGDDVVEHGCRHGTEQKDVRLLEDAFVGIAVDAAVGTDA